MSDRSYATAVIYALADPSTAPAARAILVEAGLDATAWGDTPLNTEGLRLGLHYVHEDMTVGGARDVAVDLAALGATFRITQDGIGSDCGETFAHTPELGLLEAESSGDGVMVSAYQINGAIDGTEDRNTLVRKLELLTGRRWEQALEFAASLVDLEEDGIYNDGGERASAPLPLCGDCGAIVITSCRC